MDIFAQSDNYETKKIGILFKGDYYGFDGGMGHFDLKINSVKISNNKVRLKAQLKESNSDYYLKWYDIFIAENLRKN